MEKCATMGIAEFWAELNVVLIQWEERPATLNFLRDVTERMKVETHLRQTQRMESVGRLAGTVLTADSGPAALAVYGSKADVIDLVILDER